MCSARPFAEDCDVCKSQLQSGTVATRIVVKNCEEIFWLPQFDEGKAIYKQVKKIDVGKTIYK